MWDQWSEDICGTSGPKMYVGPVVPHIYTVAYSHSVSSASAKVVVLKHFKRCKKGRSNLFWVSAVCAEYAVPGSPSLRMNPRSALTWEHRPVMEKALLAGASVHSYVAGVTSYHPERRHTLALSRCAASLHQVSKYQ